MAATANYTLTNKNNALTSWAFTNATNLTVTLVSSTSSPATVEFAVIPQTANIVRITKPYTPGVSCDFGYIQDIWVREGLQPFIRVYVQTRYQDGTAADGTINWDLPVKRYTPLSYTRYNVYRDSVNETKAIFDMAFAADPLSLSGSNRNTLTYQRQYYNGSSWVNIDAAAINVSEYSFNGTTNHTLPYVANLSYDLRVLVNDAFNQLTLVDRLPTAAVPFSLGTIGIGAGKIHERGALDVEGDFYRNNIKQRQIFSKKPTDPDPEGMEDGDILLIYNEPVSFTNVEFPQSFGTGFTWGQAGTWPTLYPYWTSASATSNTVIDSFQASVFKGNSYPSAMFDGNTNWDNQYMVPVESVPATVILKFKGSIQFHSFQLSGWAQGHEVKNSPKSFAFFGSNDAATWIPLYDTTTFPDTYNTTWSGSMNNSGLSFTYLKMVWRTNQDDNALVNGTIIAIRELKFIASGVRYV